jgi:hypothetical protein
LLPDANFNILVNHDKSEGEFFGALRFLTICSQSTLADPELLVRFFSDLFTMTFDSDWKVDRPIKVLMNTLENDRVFVRRR